MLMHHHNQLMIFTGNANREFALKVANCLNIRLGNADVARFSDGEVSVALLDNVRGADVFILQPTCYPTNENLMEILVLTDALKRASAGRITAAIPYFGYARQDRRPRSARVPISARLVADMLMVAGIDRVLTVDLHADQIQGFFNIPVDNIYASPVLLKDIRAHNYKDLIIVSPDTGGVMRARAFAKALNCDIVIVDKRRPNANEAEVMNIIGEPNGKHCIIVDDMIDTGNTLCKAALALKERGATQVSAFATHAVFSGNAIAKINASILDEVVITDTIPIRGLDTNHQHNNDQTIPATATNCNKIRIVSIASLFAETIRRINGEESVSLLLDD